VCGHSERPAGGCGQLPSRPKTCRLVRSSSTGALRTHQWGDNAPVARIRGAGGLFGGVRPTQVDWSAGARRPAPMPAVAADRSSGPSRR
jgi:hypothetical protein